MPLRASKHGPPDDPPWLQRKVIDEQRPTIAYIQHALERGMIRQAAEAYNELNSRERRAINIAPLRCRELGIAEVFTTQERAFINSPEFMQARLDTDNFTGDQL